MNFIKQKKDLDLNHVVDPSKDCIKYIKSSKEKKFTSHLYGDSIIRSDFKNYLILKLLYIHMLIQQVYDCRMKPI